jgi:hypothetical protein
MKTVKVGARTVDLVPPKSYSLAFDIVSATDKPSLRLFGAAFGACFPRTERMLKITPAQHGYDVLGYGGAVVDALLAQGVSSEDIIAAGAAALELCSSVLAGVTEQEVAAEEGFTAKPDGSTG